MRTSNKTLLAAVAAIGMGLGASAAAHDRSGYGHSKHWQKHHYERHHDRRGHGRLYYEPHHVVRERVVIHRPVYAPPPVYPVYAPPPAYYYAPARHPGVVVSVDLPPLVFQLR